MTRKSFSKFLAGTALAATGWGAPVLAQEIDTAEGPRPEIIVTGARQQSAAGTKTDTPAIETPQPITVVTDDQFLAQGALSIADTLNYVAGVQANAYGPDGRVDSSFIRGSSPLQFRDGMRDIFSFYASIRADPYNFSQVEVVRGPASVLFGQSSIGGLINLVSKAPSFETRGEIAVRYGSFDRKEMLADVTGGITDTVAARMVARVRDADTQVDFVRDDRVMLSPSLLWQPTDDTRLTLIWLYQEDAGGSVSQFLPLVGTLLPNPNGRLANSTFIGKPGWDRYDGRLLQGTALFEHRFSDAVSFSAKARSIDSNLTYLTHYPNSYSNPTNPYLDANQRIIGNYADGSIARLDIFSTDNNLKFNFNTSGNIEHVVLAGVDYSWNRVRKNGGFALETIDIYDIDYAALSNFGGGIPTAAFPGFLGGSSEDNTQKQLGFYLQDQIRLWDRVSIVLGGRRDTVRSSSPGNPTVKVSATSLRAGIIGELVRGVSPFFSYTESFDPIAGTASNGNPFTPKRGRQFEGGVKFHPDEATLVTLTAYHIKETGRPIDDPSTPDPFDQFQAGALTSKGFEIEASRRLPGNWELLANYSYTRARIDGTNRQLENVPKHNASVWGTKSFALDDETNLRIGAGLRHSSANLSFGAAFPDGLRTPSYTLVDALVELARGPWSLAVNATNLFDKSFYSACLARGDCFIGAERNVFGTVSYRF
ncbi:TonB-dependent siderophore receptor [Blastomonas sp.]|uniref:TonB-dependent siderophore receptor n=1 Tax=Blastomonas sp. TaxID=1909299 RepID=UPI00258AA6E1|nr:TonB-dependent siderophore receptor [Blastomonas sp.]